MKRPSTIEARLIADLSDLRELAGDIPAFGVDQTGTWYFVGSHGSEAVRTADGFAKSRFDRPTRYDVVCWDEGTIRTFATEAHCVISYVQPLGDDEVLLVGARCELTREGPEKNAAVFDWAGRCLRRFTLGDGISDVRTTPERTIWVSYFDEGVFGNRGFGEDGVAPIGQSGLCAFDEVGQRHFECDGQKSGFITDAYALNVRGDDDVWVYFYTDFPIVHVARARYERFDCEVRGARALAVYGKYVLLFDDYEHRALARVLELNAKGAATVIGTYDLILPEGGDAGRARVIGVGHALYILDGKRLSVVDAWW